MIVYSTQIVYNTNQIAKKRVFFVDPLFLGDMVKHELRVTSCKLKAQKHELKFKSAS